MGNEKKNLAENEAKLVKIWRDAKITIILITFYTSGIFFSFPFSLLLFSLSLSFFPNFFFFSFFRSLFTNDLIDSQ